MRNPSDTTTPSESGARPSPTRRAIERLLGHTRSTGRRHPQSTEIDAKLHASHVRPATHRAELY